MKGDNGYYAEVFVKAIEVIQNDGFHLKAYVEPVGEYKNYKLREIYIPIGGMKQKEVEKEIVPGDFISIQKTRNFKKPENIRNSWISINQIKQLGYH